MQEKLDDFDGRHVQASELRLLGSGSERIGQLTQGEEILIVAKVVVGQVGFRDKTLDRGGEPMFMRVHRGAISRFYIVPNEQGERWLAEGRALADERFGIEDLMTWAEREGPASEGEGGADGD